MREIREKNTLIPPLSFSRKRYLMQEDLVSITGGPLKPHEYILIKSEMTAGDEAWIQNYAAKQRGTKKEDMEIVFTIGDIRLATAQRLVKGWSLSKEIARPDGVKETVPIDYNPKSPGNIEKLPRRIFKFILKKIDEMNPEDEEDDDTFLPDVIDSSEDNLQAERVFRLKA